MKNSSEIYNKYSEETLSNIVNIINSNEAMKAYFEKKAKLLQGYDTLPKERQLAIDADIDALNNEYAEDIRLLTYIAFKEVLNDKNLSLSAAVDMLQNPKLWLDFQLPAERLKEFLPISNADFVNLIMQSASNADNPRRLEAVSKKSHSQQLSIFEMKDETGELIIKKEDATIILDGKPKKVEYRINVNGLKRTKQSQNFHKLFDFVCRQILLNCSEEGNRSITIFYQQLVDEFIFSSIRTARTGFNSFLEQLSTLQLDAFLVDDEMHIKQYIPPFIISNIRNAVVLYIDQRINVNFFTSYTTVMPMWANKLAPNAYILLRYLYSMARTNGNNKFKISFEMCRITLGLPTIEECRKKGNYKQRIQEPITEAYMQIIDGLHNYDKLAYDKNYLSITPHNEEETPISNWLKNGYFEVSLNAQYADKIAEIAGKRQEKLEASTKKRKSKQG